MKLYKFIIPISLLIIGLFFYYLGYVSNNNIKTSKTLIHKYSSNLEEQLNYIPENYLNEFYLNGGDFKIEEIEGNVVGSYYYDSNLIVLEKDFIDISLLHEFGHFIDDYNDYSIRPQFIECFNNDKKFISYYFQQSEEEYFAECFRMYMIGEILPTSTYNWFKNNIERKEAPTI